MAGAGPASDMVGPGLAFGAGVATGWLKPAWGAGRTVRRAGSARERGRTRQQKDDRRPNSCEAPPKSSFLRDLGSVLQT